MTLESGHLMLFNVDVHPSTTNSANYLSEVPRIKLDRSVTSFVLRRRHGVSSGNDFVRQPLPRMKRRGAISYDVTDASAMYIRYLGDAVNHRESDGQKLSLPLPNLAAREARRVSNCRRKRRGSVQSIAPSQRFHNVAVLQTIGVEDEHKTLQGGLRNVDSWDFDIFAFESITKGRPLFYLGLYLFHHLGLIDTFKLDIMKLRKFLTLVEECYHPENSYHNCTHAADVTQALHCLLSDSSMYQVMKSNEVLASLVAAICHDMDHPGVNQNYLVNTSSYLAAIHGTCSVLERHHCNAFKAILRQSGLLSHLPANDFQDVVSLVEDMILATDVSRNKEFMTQFEELILSERLLDLDIQEERRFVLQMAVKCADISNPTRKLVVSKQWSELIMEEFFRQGDKEKQLHLPISFLCDRCQTAIPRSQSDFFAFVALPLFKAWSQFTKSPLSRRLCQNIMNNKSYWDGLITNA